MKNCVCVQETLISYCEIDKRITELAEKITRDYKNSRPLVIGVLKGAWIFMADLLRKVELDVDVDFICVSSYGLGTTSSGHITLLKDITIDCTGRDVIVVEDIIDSGTTLMYLKEMLLARNASSVNIATLLSKPSRRVVDIDVKYVGFEVPDKFVVGYGMDYKERFRALHEICVLKEEVYKN